MCVQKNVKNPDKEVKSKTVRKCQHLCIHGLIGFAAFGVMVIIGIVMLIQNIREYIQGEAAYIALRNDVVISENEMGSNLESSSDNRCSNMNISSETVSRLSTASVSTLLNENPDFCGWIYQKGTNIDYPVVIGEDNGYYLSHLFSGIKNKSGCLFVDYRNADNFSDRNTVIYGHNMKNGSMFHCIVDYINPNIYSTRPTMIIYTENKTYILELFAGDIVSGGSQIIEFNFKNDKDFMNYVNNLKVNSTFESKVDVEPEDKLVTLVTCTYEFNNARYELVGKLVDE